MHIFLFLLVGKNVAFDGLTHQTYKSQQIRISFTPCYQFHCDSSAEYLEILLLSFRYSNFSLRARNSHHKNIPNSLNIWTRQDFLVLYRRDFLLLFNFTLLHTIFRVYFDLLSSSQICIYTLKSFIQLD